MPDQLNVLYSEFLEGGYDCVDRVVCNAYFPMGQSGGGFSHVVAELYGSDENLDNNHPRGHPKPAIEGHFKTGQR